MKIFIQNKRKKKVNVQKQLPVTNMIEECIQKGIQASSIYPAWRENGAKNFQELCDKVIEKVMEMIDWFMPIGINMTVPCIRMALRIRKV